MGLVIIFMLVALLALYGAFSAIKNKNVPGIIFGVGAVAVFGWFAIMTIVHSGFPAAQ
ncbi:DUF2759 domain-containing protein [Cytobacillus sp. Hz8]|uniref:DUF2759 domain-containing protein n=1 Tax=Cytobacillus sp. Hz8 TaxID=3347168 RepID=UPI0035DDC12F